jgi:Holliday junction DNA helicase RuvA
MIGFLRGKLVQKQPPLLTLDVGGIGYEVEAPMSTFYDLPDTGAELTLLTHLVVREDAHTLFGFATESERELFRNLIRVSGIGAKLALTILSGISVEGFITCVQEGDSVALTRLPGVGKKTAERLVVEMRDRVKGMDSVVVTAAAAAGSPSEDALSALVALGYKSQEAARMIKAVASEGLGSEEIIRRALQSAMQRG